MVRFPPVTIDSRRVEPGVCFIAVEGKRHDGHKFIPEALQRGAAIIVSSASVAERSNWEDRIFLQVPDTTQALQRLARCVRKKWSRSIIGVTGSIGKTTTRVFTTELLGQRFRTLQSPANFNNEIGVPLSLLRLKQEHELAVLELGMNRPGEIRSLAGICSPDAAVITNVAAVHLEFFPGLDAIAAEKGEILEALPQGRDPLFQCGRFPCLRSGRTFFRSEGLFRTGEACRCPNLEYPIRGPIQDSVRV